MTVATRTAEKNEAPFVKPEPVKPAAPKTANEVLAKVEEDHNYKHAPIDVKTTGGVQMAIERNWKAIQALADFVDGKQSKAV